MLFPVVHVMVAFKLTLWLLGGQINHKKEFCFEMSIWSTGCDGQLVIRKTIR